MSRNNMSRNNIFSYRIHPRYKRQIAVRLTYGVYNVGYGITTEGPFQVISLTPVY